MKKIYFLLLCVIPFAKSFSQNCISLGCATSHTGIITDGTLPDTLIGAGLGCYNGNSYKQVFWQFFFSPTAGNFTQTYTPTSGINLSINFVIFDIGTSAPANIGCPVNTTGWTPVTCGNTDFANQPVGPGLHSIALTTTAGDYYAVAIIIWQGTNNGGIASYTFDISTPQLDGDDFTAANCPGVLPVTLSSFNARVNNCIVDLDWTAESQSDLKNYDIQYSNDGIKFQTIATIPGTSHGTDQKYTYRDNSPKQGNIYYRLKMTGIDGKFEYSRIIALNVNCSRNSLMVYPNPVTDILNVSISNLQNDMTVARLYDTNGKLMYSGEMVSGTNIIDMKKFIKGVYILKLKNSTETQNIKIIK